MQRETKWSGASLFRDRSKGGVRNGPGCVTHHCASLHAAQRPGHTYYVPRNEPGAPTSPRQWRLRIELGIPIEIVEPAVVQVVRREAPAVAVQVVHARLERHLRRPHLGLVHRQVALPEIARRAGGDHVDPGGVAAARARQQMIEGEVVAGAAILAAELVAQEDIEAGEGGLGRGLHEGLERDNARELHLQAGAVHGAVVLGDDVYALEKYRLDGVLPGPQRQRVVAERTKIRVEHESGEA